MSAPKDKEVVVSGAAGLGAAVATESGTELGELADVQARGYWELVWIRFKRDKIAIVSGIFIVLLILTVFAGAPLARKLVGHGPDDIFPGTNAISTAALPAGPWTWVTYDATIEAPPYLEKRKDLFVLGASDQLGRD